MGAGDPADWYVFYWGFVLGLALFGLEYLLHEERAPIHPMR